MPSLARSPDFDISKSRIRPGEDRSSASRSVLYIYSVKNTQIDNTQYWDAFHLNRGRRNSRRLGAPQAAVGLVVNPSLCPAFRVRRGSGREYGSMTSRARRATRPTPSEFRCHVGMAPTSAAGERAGAPLAARFAPRSPAFRGRAWEHARSRAGTPTGSTGVAASAGHDAALRPKTGVAGRDGLR